MTCLVCVVLFPLAFIAAEEPENYGTDNKYGTEDFCCNIRIHHVRVTYGCNQAYKRCNHAEETASVD